MARGQELGAPWDRLYSAAAKGAGAASLREQLGAEALALLTRENLKALAVVLGVWAAANLAGGPVAWAVSAGLAVPSLVALGGDIVLASSYAALYARTAYRAQSQAELDQAAGYFTAALVEAGSAVLTLALGAESFTRAKAAILQSRLVWAGERPEEEEPTRPQEDRPTAEPSPSPQEHLRDPEDMARGPGAPQVGGGLGTILAVGGGGLLAALVAALLLMRRWRRR